MISEPHLVEVPQVRSHHGVRIHLPSTRERPRLAAERLVVPRLPCGEVPRGAEDEGDELA